MWTRRFLGALTGACLMIALGCFALVWRNAGERHLVPFASPIPGESAPASASLPMGPPGTRDVRARPLVKVSIPAVGLSARVVPVGLTNTGHIDMPHPSVVGWYRPGLPADAASRPAVLIGHVDSQHGPAVFYRLSGVRPGETVNVLRADGSRSRFVISKVTVVSKVNFPTQAVFGPTRRAVIRLITCTGPFDADSGYADSLIVWGH